MSDLSGKFDLGCVLTLTDESRIDLGSPGDQERRALEAWHGTEVQPAGEPTFPPAKAHPQEVARWTTNAVAGFVIVKLSDHVSLLGLKESWLLLCLKQGTWLLGLVLLIIGARRLWQVEKINLRAKDVDRRDPLAGQASPLQGPAEEVEVRVVR